jgi:large subunit ribosomal protein L6
LVNGPRGSLTQRFANSMQLTRDNGTIRVERPDNERQHRALHGLTRTLLNNMVVGVTDGYRRDLEIHGVGYRASMQGKALSLNLGFSHPVTFDAPAGISIETPSQTEILVKGADKQAVGQVAAKIRGLRPPEPYKGKGVRYADEKITLKEAKKA